MGLLGPVPTKDGECKRRVMHDAPFEDWVEVKLVFGGVAAGSQRIVTALFDADDQPGSVTDVVTIPGRQRRETVSGRVVSGRFQGTHLVTENDRQTPRPLTPAEEEGLRAIAAELRKRYP